MAAGKSSIHRQVLRFSRFCGPPPISASPTEIWGLIFCYQVLLIKCTIYIKPRVDLRGPYFNGSDGQKQARRFCGNEQAIFASTHDRILWFERIGLDHGVASTRARRFCRNKPLRQQNWLRSIEGAKNNLANRLKPKAVHRLRHTCFEMLSTHTHTDTPNNLLQRLLFLKASRSCCFFQNI